MKAVALVAVLSAFLATGSVADARGRQAVTLTAAPQANGTVLLTACGLKSSFGRIVVEAPNGSQSTSGDLRTQNGCVSYVYAPPGPGIYVAQAYALSAPGRKPHIAATTLFEVT
jgi:hypothetical protein